MEIEAGHLYLAPVDHHLMVENEHMIITQGTQENRYRPSIDVLFRSAAAAFGNRVIAIILTGMLEDGTSGMSAVKRCGGVTIVQDPDDAQFPSMPISVMNNMQVDYRSYLENIPLIIHEVLSQPLPPSVAIPKEIETEVNITKRMMSDIDALKTIADHSDFVCPDCGGGLWQIRGEQPNRYRCHTGHVYTEKLLHDLQDERIEESVWVSIRMLEEKANLLKVMASRNTDAENGSAKPQYPRRIEEVEGHINRLKKLLNNLVDNGADKI
ncbi:hypothetical protein FNO01nite_32630 [Flavobacterium noncentrifugens]|nr:hypothetical protein FNO01nite_32630 [Flavobacterium noncentrifugens]